MNTPFQKLEQLCKKYQVKALYVFGSRSAEVLHALEDDSYELDQSQSDLDIGILPHSPLSLDIKISLTLELEELFNVSRVDLVVLQEVDAFLAASIIRGERVFAEDPYFADEYDLFVLRRAGDLAALERERMAMILQEG